MTTIFLESATQETLEVVLIPMYVWFLQLKYKTTLL